MWLCVAMYTFIVAFMYNIDHEDLPDSGETNNSEDMSSSESEMYLHDCVVYSVLFCYCIDYLLSPAFITCAHRRYWSMERCWRLPGWYQHLWGWHVKESCTTSYFVVCPLFSPGTKETYQMQRQFLSIVFKVLGRISPQLSDIYQHFPRTLYELRKILGTSSNSFVRYVSCKKCSSVYKYSECVEKIGSRVSRHASSCNGTLLKRVELQGGKIIYYPVRVFC